MKEATGELNVMVIVAIIVAMLAFFFFGFIWPRINENFRHSSSCDDAICICEDKDDTGKCRTKVGEVMECHIKGNESKTIMCPWEG